MTRSTEIPIKRQTVFIENNNNLFPQEYHPETSVRAITDIGEALMGFTDVVIFPEVDNKITTAFSMILEDMMDKVPRKEFEQVVKHTKQNLTEEQQLIARSNLGLGNFDKDSFENFREQLSNISTAISWKNIQLSNPSDKNAQYEFWTGKYYLGRKIYGKLIDFRSLPTQGTKVVNHFVEDIDHFVNLHAIGFNNGNFITVPSPDVATSNNSQGIGLRADNRTVRITVRQNWSNYNAIVTIEYICKDR